MQDMKQLFDRLDDPTRRTFVARLAKTALGVSILPTVNAAWGADSAAASGKAKQVIYLFMNGAMSHLETFDPKPGVESGGPTQAIATSVSGVKLSQHLPKLAQQMDKLAVVRSMTTETGAHQQGSYLMRTSYKQIASTRHPFMGAWLSKIEGKINEDLPGSVLVGGANRHPMSGFLGARYAPAPVANAAKGMQNTKPPGYLSEKQFDQRLRLTRRFEKSFSSEYKMNEVNSYVDFYREATKLLKSQDLKAFDISSESKEVKDAYGNNGVGQGALLARRLVEKGVRFIEVNFGGWDNHRDIFNTIPNKAGQLDQAVSALLTDLQGRGLLSQTLVVVGTEFGRTPKINVNTGRDHHPGAFSCMLAGAGIKGGQVYGKTDKDGRSVDDGHCYPADLNATIASALKLPIKEEFFSPAGRPFKVAHDGTPINELLS